MRTLPSAMTRAMTVSKREASIPILSRLLPTGILRRAIGFKQFRSNAVKPLIVFGILLRFTRYVLLDFPNLQQRFGFAQFDLFHNSITSAAVGTPMLSFSRRFFLHGERILGSDSFSPFAGIFYARM